MRFNFKICCFLSFIVVSCAQRVDQASESYYKSEAIGYLLCNVFADQTFRGKVWIDSEASGSNCVSLDISKTPKELLKNETLFLQIYPFTIKDDKMNYGSSVTIRTKEKGLEKRVLMESKIIDTYFVETLLDLEPDHFFRDHFLEICGIGKEWDGLQLVIYEGRVSLEKPIPLRVTKFLLPPFLTHPGHFKERKGNALAAFHPFLEFVSDFQSTPSSYYDLAGEMCDYTL